MNYKQVLAFLNARPNFERSQKYSYKRDLDLARVRNALTALNDPHYSYPSIVVAGTNGKGSVCAMLSAALCAHGYRVGLYTSPHIIDIRERIQVNGVWISTIAFRHIVSRIRRKVLAKILRSLTYFELMTVIMFVYFAQKKVDIAVLEVGMGGRLDATNVVKPLVSVITEIGFDHEDKLGRTLSKIAGEKAGIIKKHGLVVSAPQKPEAAKAITACARKQDAHLYMLKRNNAKVKMRLLGEHQRENYYVALHALRCIRPFLPHSLQESVIKRAMTCVTMPGRLELIARRPDVFLDGAHNAAALDKSFKALTKTFPGRRRVIVIGIARDKNLKRIVKVIERHRLKMILTQSSSERALSFHDFICAVSGSSAIIAGSKDVRAAIDLARTSVGAGGVVHVCGSFYLIADVKKIKT
ncbi:MAG: bifunctional folylpolyglutamate synthase/dihydrofolate synthase [Candidatus Omnitrophica bacterium]|nr:bifunctional folylpolyglutamate synthase/dihydrofolate synthase [Candidatus Omnitrophota bacterium]